MWDYRAETKNVTDLVEQICVFQVKLDLFSSDLNTGRMLHFPMQKHLIPGTHHRCDDRFHCEVEGEFCQLIG